MSVTDFIIDKSLMHNPKDIFMITHQTDITIIQAAADSGHMDLCFARGKAVR